jgi:2-polyprenyl-3-methyl-5-hydroxy-6-metoxy-1,4-benzoquinol methylase
MIKKNDSEKQADQLLFNRIKRIGSASGQIILPCVPALTHCYVEQILALFELLGIKFNQERVSDLTERLQTKLEQGYQASQHSQLVVRYQPAKPPQLGLVLDIEVEINTLKNFYEKTVSEHFGAKLEQMETEVFGKHPNAKVIDVALKLPQNSRVLDIGAGSGRNTLPLARMNLAVDAIELAEIFSTQLQSLSDRQSLPIKVIQADILDPLVRLPFGHYQLAILAEILPHFRDPDQVRLVLAKMCDGVAKDGLILFNTFVTQSGYMPSEAEKQVGQVSQAFFLTDHELRTCLNGLPLEILTRESVYEYEKTHLPPEAFPPSPWFELWTRGRLVFDCEEVAIALEWILCRRI